jgi:hypothetical protein
VRYTTTILFLAAIALLSAARAHANGEQQLSLGNLNEWGGANWDSPTATTGGAIWIQTGDVPVKLDNRDVNALLRINAPNGADGFAWITLATLLLSVPEGSGHFDAQNNWIGSSIGINSWTGVPGLIWDPNSICYGIPNTSSATGPSDHYQIELYLWCGKYDTYAAAVAAAQPVAYSGVVSQLVFAGDPPPPPNDLSNLPAMILRSDLLGDANMDRKVDINDLTKVLTSYNQTDGMSWSTGDFNNDGKVDINDLTIVLSHYNQSAGSPAGGLAAIPEPSALVLLATLVPAVAWGFRRLV